MDKNVRAFVESIDNLKKQNPADLSSDQDLSIGIMNLISIEEHLFFSGVKTGKNDFFDMVEPIREIRKEMLQKIIQQYEGEVWCISKHLLAASMRLMEVGTKQQSLGNKEEAVNMFNKSYDLYCIFWAMNANSSKKNVNKEIKTETNEIVEIAKKELNKVEEIAYQNISQENHNLKNNSKMQNIRNMVSKLLNCCKE